jgi:hypothetical protein
MLPPTIREAFLDAMTRFDQEMRSEPDWQDWEQDPHYKYASDWNGRHYPVSCLRRRVLVRPVRRPRQHSQTA